MPAGIVGKAGKKLLKWGEAIIGDVAEETKKVKKPKKSKKSKAEAAKKKAEAAKKKAEAAKKKADKAEKWKKEVGKLSREQQAALIKMMEADKAKGKRGRKKTPRGKIPAAVKEIMDELGVDRKEATKILADRKKAAVKPKPTRTRTEGVPKRWRGFLKAQQAQMRETDPNYVPPGGSKMTRIKTGSESVPFAQRVEQGPPRSKIPPPLRSEQSPAQVRRRVKQGFQGITPKGEIKDIGQWAPPRQDIGGKRGITDDQIADVMEMVERGDLTLKKKGGSIKSKKTKRRSASKPKGVGQAMRGWGATMKRRT
jgi:hypothetical protein